MGQQTSRISDNLMAEPHITGRRVSVLQIYEQVEGAGRSPADVASQLALDILDVHAALRYYENNREEMERVRQQRAEHADELGEAVADERPEGVSPP